MTSDSATVFVVDDDSSVRTAIRRLLGAAGYVVRTHNSARGLFAEGRPKSPCCLILDVGLPDTDGLSFQKLLHRDKIRIPIIFITGRGDIPMSVRAMKAGAVDFLPKPFESTQLLNCVRNALEADAQSLPRDEYESAIRRRLATLSPREREVFAAVTTGMLNKQVGYELGIAEKTIKVHRAHVMEKMGAQSLADLVRMAQLLLPELYATGSAPGAMSATSPL